MDNIRANIENNAFEAAKCFQIYILTVAPVTMEERTPILNSIDKITHILEWPTHYDEQLGRKILGKQDANSLFTKPTGENK